VAAPPQVLEHVKIEPSQPAREMDLRAARGRADGRAAYLDQLEPGGGPSGDTMVFADERLAIGGRRPHTNGCRGKASVPQAITPTGEDCDRLLRWTAITPMSRSGPPLIGFAVRTPLELTSAEGWLSSPPMTSFSSSSGFHQYPTRRP
jgi:hypothetical protein